MKLTPNQRLADMLLGEDIDLVPWVLDQIDEGVPAAVVARKLADRTRGQVDVSDQSMRNWVKQFREDREPAA